MVVPVVAGIPLVYEMLVGAGILAGGAVAANQMQKEIQTTIDKNPEIIDQALKNVFTGPASRLIDPNFLKEMQAKKPTPTNQGTTKREAIETEVSPDDQGMFIASPEQRAFLFGTRDTPSGTVLAPDATDIEKQRKEAISKPLITPMPVGQQDQTLVTPVPEKTTVLPGMDPAPTPIQNEGFSMPTTPDTSILNQDKPEETKNQIKTWETMGNNKNIEEVKQRLEKAGIPFDEVESLGIKQQITFKKDSEGYGVYFDRKLIGRMDDITQGLKDDNPELYKGNEKIFNLSFLDSRGHTDAATDTINTIAEAKYVMKRYLAGELLKKESLVRRNFENQKYDKKGNPLIDEKYEMSASDKKISSLIKENNSNPSGSLIDKPAQIELPDKAALKEESKLGDELFKLSETGTVQDYETFKNNPIIKKKIALSVQLYKDTTANPGYGTAEYWADRPFTKGVNGYKELVKKVYDRKKIKNNKEFYIVMGPSSAGKSTGLVDKLQKETGSFLADSDEIKKLIPEFNNGYNANGVHKESSDINARILAMAMKAGDNVIYPTTGREAGKLKGIIDNAEKKGYNVKVNLVTADRSVLLLRNLGRMLKTNRVVDGDKLLTEEIVNGIEETYNNLDEKYKGGKIDTTPKR
jgi:predicted ABC-type ATPase